VHAFKGRTFGRAQQENREQSGKSDARRAAAIGGSDRLARRRRWLLLAAGVVGVAGLVAGVSAPDRLVDAGQVDVAPVPEDSSTSWALSELSKGAPEGAVTLAPAPVTSTNAQPITATVVTGLAANGIPNVALNAYRVAAARMESAQPDCGIDWSLLAGIGRIESNHGRFGGALLNSDGTSTPEIRGPALNGVDFAYIADSDNGTFDHDSSYDRAVGPMQFIPTTWRSYAIDADGNGTTDPFDIDDAALGAAHYLCVAGGDLTSDTGQRRAVLAYNHSDSYVAEVLALARAYAAGIPVESLPLVGNTSGAVPPPTGYYRAPAAPGPAIGAKDTTPASGDTVGQRDSGAARAGGGSTTARPATPAGSSGGGAAPAPSGGTGGTGTAAGQPAQPAPEPAPAPAPANPQPNNPVPNIPVPQNPPPRDPVPPSPPVTPPDLPDIIPGVCGTLGLPVCPK
jgi:hypothetical protein